MTKSNLAVSEKAWKEIASIFLKLRGTNYGGPAMLGIMQAELQEKRQWVSKERFVEGLSLVNMLPGATATQLSIFLGFSRGGWWGGLLAGLCFVLPGFFIMLALTLGYAAYGASSLLKGALYGLGPVVIGVFVVAVYRLGRSVVVTIPQLIIAVTAVFLAALSSLGIVAILTLAGGIAVLLFHSRKLGTSALGIVVTLILLAHFAGWSPAALGPAIAEAGASRQAAGLFDIGSFFVMVGAFSFGGGLTTIAFVQEHVVNQYHWLTQQEFIDGLALGQLTPGPILMVSTYVGYKLAGFAGAAVCAAGTFLPSFVLMLSILPAFDRVRGLLWTKAAMKGIGPAVIGILCVSLFQMAPHGLPDPFAVAILIGTVTALLLWRISAIKLVVAGALLGVLRSRLSALPGVTMH